MDRDRSYFLMLNIGHFLDHLFTLVFATVAALALSREWGLGYGELLQYATPGFVAFGVCALPAGWLADKWSRDGMMCVFFVGIGVAAIAAGFSQTPLQIAEPAAATNENFTDDQDRPFFADNFGGLGDRTELAIFHDLTP